MLARGLRGRAMLSTFFWLSSRFSSRWRNVSRIHVPAMILAHPSNGERSARNRLRDAFALSTAEISRECTHKRRGIITCHRERACRYLPRSVRSEVDGCARVSKAENERIRRAMCSGFRPGGDCTDLVRVRLGRRHCRDPRNCIYIYIYIYIYKDIYTVFCVYTFAMYRTFFKKLNT